MIETSGRPQTNYPDDRPRVHIYLPLLPCYTHHYICCRPFRINYGKALGIPIWIFPPNVHLSRDACNHRKDDMQSQNIAMRLPYQMAGNHMESLETPEIYGELEHKCVRADSWAPLNLESFKWNSTKNKQPVLRSHGLAPACPYIRFKTKWNVFTSGFYIHICNCTWNYRARLGNDRIATGPFIRNPRTSFDVTQSGNV